MSQRVPLKDLEFIRDFAAFCRTKGDESYNYTDRCGCACAQFLQASGRADEPDVEPDQWFGNDGLWHPMPYVVDNMGGGVLANEPRTFSALADRLEALLVDAPVEVPGRLGLSADRAGGLRPEPLRVSAVPALIAGAGDVA